MEVVAEAGTVGEALDRLRHLEVDLAVVDAALREPTGATLLEAIAREHLNVKLVVVSSQAEEECVITALRGGASSYVLKATPASTVVEAIRQTLAGRHYLSPVLADRAVDGYLRAAGARPPGVKEAVAELTARETEVVRHLCLGMSKTEVANLLFISVRTVETHRSNAMRRLDLHSQVDLVRYAIWSGLISQEEDPVRPPEARLLEA